MKSRQSAPTKKPMYSRHIVRDRLWYTYANMLALFFGSMCGANKITKIRNWWKPIAVQAIKRAKK